MASGASPSETVGERFTRLYGEWSGHVQRQASSYSSLDRDYVQNPHFDAIVEMGPDAVPFIMEKLRSDDHAHFLIHALAKITGKRFSPEELAAHRAGAAGPLGNQAMARLWLAWWDSRQPGGSESTLSDRRL
jgi:hypothetical protein